MPPAAPSSAVSPSHNSLEPLDPNQPALPRQPNPHSNCGTPARPISAVSSLGGFRTPAAERAAPSLKRPASETLHKSRLTRRNKVACSITSSARTSSGIGTLLSKTLSVLRLIMSFVLFDCAPRCLNFCAARLTHD